MTFLGCHGISFKLEFARNSIPLGLRRTSRFDGSAPGKGPSCTRIPPLKYRFHKQAIILGISIEEHQTLMKDLSSLATGNRFQATRRDLLLNDRKVSSSSWQSLVRLGRSIWLIAQQNSCLANDSTYASGIYTLYFEV